MKIKKRSLPEGWYPSSAAEVQATVEKYRRNYAPKEAKSLAGIAPHAGWFFSGDLAYRVISTLSVQDTCVVIGGHLGQKDSLCLYSYDGFETPLGILKGDEDLQLRIIQKFQPHLATDGDNTVEVQLPLLHSCFPSLRVVCLRCPPNAEAIRLGKFLAALRKEGKSIVLLASTDLTHYGPNYGFISKGVGEQALQWVRNENDFPFLEAALHLDPDEVLAQAEKNQSACSAGAAAAAVSFARELGLKGTLVGYGTSWEKHPSSSFVGYGGIIYT
ncbi:MAG: AmmeMemoRadiSam system protein B [Spirochaetales bacterium]